MKELIQWFNHGITLAIIFPAIIGLGLYLTIKLQGAQIAQLKLSFNSLIKKNLNHQGDISRFQAISAVLAGNFGTGNISGIAIALATGGPGALVWMWIMAFFGSIIQYASCVLGVSFRQKTKSGEYVGGPMYYLRDGLGYHKLAGFFALCTIFGSMMVGNFAQINSIILPLKTLGFHPIYCSVVIAMFVGMITLGGIQRLAKVAAIIVPLKAALYLGTALVIIVLHYDRVVPAFEMMFKMAFDFSALIGGVAGIGVLKAISTGFDRGLFATDAGIGIVPILQANARSDNPIMDGIATLVAPFMVMVVCTATGLVLMVTDAWQIPGLESTNMVTYAFSRGIGSPVGGYIVIVTLVLFAYTTILAWAYCGEKALEFLVGAKWRYVFRILSICLVPLGAWVQVKTVWALADMAIALMLVVNLIGIAKLSSHVMTLKKQFN